MKLLYRFYYYFFFTLVLMHFNGRIFLKNIFLYEIIYIVETEEIRYKHYFQGFHVLNIEIKLYI